MMHALENNPIQSAAMGIRPGPAWVIVGVVGLFWLLLGAGDWFFRFHWFRWQQSFVLNPALWSAGPAAPLQQVARPASVGGNLTRMVAIPSFNRRYAQARPAYLELSDEYGYRNVPPTTNRYYPVVSVGDSFMNTGEPMTNMFSARLAEVSGVAVYNHAMDGRGQFQGLLQFIKGQRWAAAAPRILIFGMVEMDIYGPAYVGLLAHLPSTAGTGGEADAAQARINWAQFAPARLNQDLPNSSMMAQAARWLWNRARFACFNRITPEVVPSAGAIVGQPLLFYRYSIDNLKWSPAYRDIPKVVFTMRHLNEYCRSRGITLVALLIPDAADVYRDLIPPELNPPANPIPPSSLDLIEVELTKAGIRTVNLLGSFRARAAEGALLYWPDDTHWNAEGIHLAAEATGRAIRDLLEKEDMRYERRE